MAANICTLIALAILLALTQTSCSTLNCENLDAASCKQQFGQLLDNKIRNMQVAHYKENLERARAFYSGLLEDLNENDTHTEPIRRHLSILNASIPKLNQDADAETMKSIIIEMRASYDPDFSKIAYDDESKKTYDNLLLKYNFEKFHNDAWLSKKEFNEKMIEAWEKFSVNLRPIDLETYSDYEKIYAILKVSQTYNSADIWKVIGEFFDAPYLKAIYCNY